jgi:hypothetical protein
MKTIICSITLMAAFAGVPMAWAQNFEAVFKPALERSKEAVTNMDTAEIEECRKELLQAIELAQNESQKSSAQLYYALSFYHFGDYPKALVEFRKVLEMSEAGSNPRSGAQVGIGNCFFKEGDYENAKTELAKVGELPNAAADHVAEANYMLGAIALKEMNPDEARKFFTLIIEQGDAPEKARDDAQRRLDSIK